MNRTARAYLVRYRREIAALLAGLAALIAVNALTPLHSARIVTAARDLPAGQVLRPSDLRVVASTVSWSGAYSVADDVVGRTTSHALAAGEPVTGASIMGVSLLEGQVRGRVAVALPVGTPDAELVHAGDIVDVLSASERVAVAASVIAVSVGSSRAFAGPTNGTVIVAVYPHEAEGIAAGRAAGAGTFMLALLQR